MNLTNLKKYTRGQLEAYCLELWTENQRLASDRWIIDDVDLSAVTALTEALDASGGYWRVGKSADGNYWARWKWTQGPYKGGYVMGGHNSMAKAVLMAQVEYDKVLRGKRSPIMDKGYSTIAKGR